MTSRASDGIDVYELARQRGEVQGELPLAAAARLAAELIDSEGSLRYRLAGRLDDLGRPAAQLELAGAVRMRCDRCAAPVTVPIAEHGAFFFVADEDQLARLPIEDAPDEPLLGSRHFDLAGLVEDQAILALPISPRHAHCLPPARAEKASAHGAPEEGQRPFEALVRLKPRKA